MSDTTPALQPVELADTAPQTPEPAASPPGKWEMPQPVFQQTSGYLPQGFEKFLSDVKQNNGATPTAAAAVPPDPVTEPALPAVEPQPDISEHLGLEGTAAISPTAPKPKSPGLRIVLAVLAIGGILFFVAVFLMAAYFLFLAPTE